MTLRAGDRYLLRGELVTVLCRWGKPSEVGSAACPECGRVRECAKGSPGWFCGCRGWEPRPPLLKAIRQGPRNVLIEFEDGRLVVRPFRGLRRT